jgi:hypothetical protein
MPFAFAWNILWRSPPSGNAGCLWDNCFTVRSDGIDILLPFLLVEQNYKRLVPFAVGKLRRKMGSPGNSPQLPNFVCGDVGRLKINGLAAPMLTRYDGRKIL